MNSKTIYNKLLAAFKPYENMDENELARLKESITIEGDNYKYVVTPYQMPNMLKRFEQLAKSENGKGYRSTGTGTGKEKHAKLLQEYYVQLQELDWNRLMNLRNKIVKALKKDSSTYGYLSIDERDKVYIIDLLLKKLLMKAQKEKTKNVQSHPIIEIVDYSEKSIALIGETKPHREKLKVLYCKFNPFLTIRGKKQPGWIASKKHEAEIVEFINNL